MTRQEIFTKVYKHLMKQGRKALSTHGGCQYRSPYGLKCAIGCLIPNGLYDPEWDNYGTGVTIILTESKELTKLLGGRRNVNMLQSLQSVHDDNKVEYWKEALEKAAKKHGMEIPT